MENLKQLLPLGYRFLPTDVELIRDFFINKLKNQKLPCNTIVEYDIYSREPCDLKGSIENGDIGGAIDKSYYFVYREKKSCKASRPNRVVNSIHGGRGGFWKATGGDKEIRDDRDNKLIGVKKSLKFFSFTTDEKTTKESESTDWIMHEYSLPPASKNVFQPWVLCSIRCKGDVHDQEKKGENLRQEASDHRHNHVQPILQQGQQPLIPSLPATNNTIIKDEDFRSGAADTSSSMDDTLAMSGACSNNHQQAAGVSVAAAGHLINDNNNNNAHNYLDNQQWLDDEIEKLPMLPMNDDYNSYQQLNDDYNSYNNQFSYCHPINTFKDYHDP